MKTKVCAVSNLAVLLVLSLIVFLIVKKETLENATGVYIRTDQVRWWIKKSSKTAPATLDSPPTCLPIDTNGDHTNLRTPAFGDIDCLLNFVIPEEVKSVMDTVVGFPKDGKCKGHLCSETEPYNEHLRNWGDDWPPKGYTMVGKVRLRQFMESIAEVIHNNIGGAIVELGVWRGGAMMSAAAMCKAFSFRPLHIFDAFEVIPGYDADMQNFLQVDMDYVKQGFEKYGLMSDKVHFHKGLFESTVPKWKHEDSIAVLRVDGNFYDSYQDAMYYMYESVPVGGIVIFDDVMSHPNVMRFWEDFKKDQRLEEELVRIDEGSAWFRKRNTVTLNWKFFRAPQDANKGAVLRMCPKTIQKCHPSWPSHEQ